MLRLGKSLIVAAVLLSMMGSTGAALGALATAPAPVPLTSSSCPTDIKQGESDGCVTQLQLLLNENGFGLNVDGVFGGDTFTAVKTYQQDHSMSADGIVGPLTKTAIDSTPTSAPGPIVINSPRCPTDLKQGEKDGCVTQLQQLLNNNGAQLAVDGTFGGGTLTAVENFQRAHGLSADGIVGPDTKSALLASNAPVAIALTSSACPTDIAEGEVDGCVTELQILLNQHGAGLSVDGHFGGDTLAAVKNYQGGHGLAQDGLVGPNTKAALAGGSGSAPSPIALTSSACPTDITEGEKDGCVTELQELLNTHGAGLSVDGNFGGDTLVAVKNYQGSHGLSQDGIVGPDTKAPLYGTGGSGGTPTPPSGDVLSKIVSYAQAVENGDAETGWGGGKIWYIWGGGHGRSPGPSKGTCVGDPQSWACDPSAHPQDPSAIGLDCSGFARWVYSLAYGQDVLGSGGTSSQIGEMTRIGSPVPGDLVFFGASASDTDHVGVYIGNGQMINALETGYQVRTDNITAGGHLIGYYQY